MKVNLQEQFKISNDDGSNNQIFVVRHSPMQAIIQTLYGYRKGEVLDNVIGPVQSQSTVSLDYHAAEESYNDPGIVLAEFNNYLVNIGLNQFAYAELIQNNPTISQQQLQPIFDIAKTLEHISAKALI